MKTILLLGPKHSGKTSAGRALARLWGEESGRRASFTDLDELVELRTGKSPRDLYREGPELFRKAEAEALRVLLDQGEPNPPGSRTAPDERMFRVVAAGGGLADNSEAMDLLRNPVFKNSGRLCTVCIEVPAETAWKRIEAAAAKNGQLPPFLETGDPRETHRQLHRRREAAYREIADLGVRAGETPEETAALIKGAVNDLE
jgi:shikimate kinase